MSASKGMPYGRPMAARSTYLLFGVLLLMVALCIGSFSRIQQSPIVRGLSTSDAKRICIQNPFSNSLNVSLAKLSRVMDYQNEHRTSIERDIVNKSRNSYGHTRFEVFQALAACNATDVGGKAGDNVSKIVCGIASLKAPCTVYSLGGNNQWEFELDIINKTPCTVHTFDCTGPRSRFSVPTHERLNSTMFALGTRNLTRRPATQTSKVKCGHCHKHTRC